MSEIPPDIISSALQGHQATRRSSTARQADEEARARRAERLRKQLEEHETLVERSDETDDQQIRVRGDEHNAQQGKDRQQAEPDHDQSDRPDDQPKLIDIQA